MKRNSKDRPLYQRIAIDVAGFGLMIISPLLGWLPGPGGIPLFLAGLGLVSLNHEWAENLLRNFEWRRQELTAKYLMTSARVSHTVDAVCILIVAGGIYLAATQEQFLYKAVGLGSVTLCLIVLISNQRRFERIVAKFKKHKH